MNSLALFEQCCHDQLNDDGTCSTCGLVCQSMVHRSDTTYHPGHSLNRNQEKSILEDMKSYPLEPEIKYLANEIFLRTPNNTRRGNRRKMLIFVCLNGAYKAKGITRDPFLLAQIVGLQKKDVYKAISLYSELNTGIVQVNKTVTPFDLLEEYCDKLEIDKNFIPVVRQVGGDIYDKDETLKEETPSLVSASLLLYTLSINGYEVRVDLFAPCLGLKEATLNKMLKRIAIIDNTIKPKS